MRHVLFATLLFCASCALSPELNVAKIEGPDLSGARKFRMPTGALNVSTSFKVTESLERVGSLNVSVANVPYGDVYSLSGSTGFWQRTSVTATISNDRLLNTVNIATEDLAKDRIEAFGGVVGSIVGLLSAGAGDAENQEEVVRLKAFPKAWQLTFSKLLDDGSFGSPINDETILNKDRTPTGWTYSLEYDPPSITALDIASVDIEELADSGIIVHPSCQRVNLTLNYAGVGAPTKSYNFSHVIPNPLLLETLKLPAKGAASFSGCVVNITSSSVVERDVLDSVNTLSDQAAAIKKAIDG